MIAEAVAVNVAVKRDQKRPKMIMTRTEAQVITGGAEGIRTPDPHNAIVVLYQLSYDPIRSGSDTVGIT